MHPKQTDPGERQALILSHVREMGQGSIDFFADTLGVTRQTIRRDVNQLCELGQLRRVHGGVAAIHGVNLQYATRRTLNETPKRRIGAAFSRLVQNRASLAVSIGTTPEIAVDALVDQTDLTIVTNNLSVAMLSCSREGWNIQIPGGMVRPSDRDIIGGQVPAFFSRYQVDFGLFGVAGVAEDGTLLDFTDEEVEARLTIRENCRCAVLVLDHSKFNRPAHVRGGHITDADLVICDTAPPDAIRAALAEAGSELIIAEEVL